MVDILTGDILVVNSIEYSIAKANPWTFEDGASPSFLAMASVDCSTKRSPTEDADGHIGPPEENLTGLKCLPLSPVGDQLLQSAGLDRYEAEYETIISDSDGFVQLFLEEGDPT